MTASELIQLLQTVPADAQVDRQDNEFNYFDVNYVGYSKKHTDAIPRPVRRGRVVAALERSATPLTRASIATLHIDTRARRA